MTHKLIKSDNYLLVVDDSEIKEGDCYLSPSGVWFYNHLNPNHSKECKKVIAHLPLDNDSILEGVPLLPPIEDDVEISQWVYDVTAGIDDSKLLHDAKLFLKDGYNKAKEKYKYTEEDISKAYWLGVNRGNGVYYKTYENFIQSLHQYPTPTEFECEVEHVLTIGKTGYPASPKEIIKTITTAQGIQWVGKYK